MKMLGRLGWRGQCSCCNGPRDKHQLKREEKRLWQRERDMEWPDEYLYPELEQDDD